MINHASDFELQRKLGSFDCQILNRHDKLDIVRKNVLNHIKIAFENSSKRYNLRSNVRKFCTGENVLRRNFAQSNAGNKFCAKFAPKFIKAKVVGIKGNNMYELEDEETNKREFYHSKDMRNFPL